MPLLNTAMNFIPFNRTILYVSDNGKLSSTAIPVPGGNVFTTNFDIALKVASYGVVYDATAGSFVTLKSLPDNANNQAVSITGLQGVVSRLQGFNPLTGFWDRMQVGSDNTDANIPDATGHLNVLGHNLAFNGATWDRKRQSNVFKTAPATAAGSTAVWTPAAGKRFRLLGFTLTLSENATLAVAGLQTIQFFDAATAIAIAYDVYIPAAAVAGVGTAFTINVDLGELGYLSGAINQALNANLSVALTAGQWRINVRGTEE